VTAQSPLDDRRRDQRPRTFSLDDASEVEQQLFFVVAPDDL